MEDDPDFRLARDAYARTLAIGGAQRERLPTAALEALAGDVVSLLASRLRDAPPEGDAPGTPSPAAFDAFVRALLDSDAHRAADHIDGARAMGAGVEAIYLGYLARAARHLGALWDRDRIDFVQVTVAIGCLYAIMRSLRQSLPAVRHQDPWRHALFITMPGDDHRLGAAIAADLFRAQGWDIQLEGPADRAAAVTILMGSDHSVVGISASRNAQLSELIRLVSALRICRPEAFIVVSGHIVEEMQDLQELVDADAVVGSAPSAIERLEELIANQRRTARGR
ncbi:MAG: cobalamin B12-binding domain-containing protein [Pseudomonadota bacterium]